MHDQATGPRFLYQYWGLYQGHYIGLVEGQVIAMALTPLAAFARARQSRPRRMPTVVQISSFNFIGSRKVMHDMVR